MPYKDKEQAKEYAKAYRQAHKEKLKQWHHNRYLRHREEALAKARKRNKFEKKAYNKAYGRKMKIEVISAYSQGECKCVSCGESRLDCLSIDHVNNDGYKHRKAIGLTGGGSRFYRWLKNNNFPLGYQVLCMNCQFIKRMS